MLDDCETLVLALFLSVGESNFRRSFFSSSVACLSSNSSFLSLYVYFFSTFQYCE